MTQTPDNLLKKLKATPSFEVTPKSIEDLAKLAIDLGPRGFSARWEELNAKPVRKTKAKKPVSPELKSATDTLNKFYKARQMKSGEAAKALVNFAQKFDAGLPVPTAASKKSAVGAVKWLASKTSDVTAKEMADRFVSSMS
ncbi:MAG: hypothetical protein AAFQ22_02455 [Pseudomonadota bacterium]